MINVADITLVATPFSFTVTSQSGVLTGQWSNVMALHSNQPLITLDDYGQAVLTLGSNQDTFRIEMP